MVQGGERKRYENGGRMGESECQRRKLGCRTLMIAGGLVGGCRSIWWFPARMRENEA